MELERDFMELERDAHGISADLPGCFNSYNWLINMVFWEWFYEIGFTIWDLGNGDFTMGNGCPRSGSIEILFFMSVIIFLKISSRSLAIFGG